MIIYDAKMYRPPLMELFYQKGIMEVFKNPKTLQFSAVSEISMFYATGVVL